MFKMKNSVDETATYPIRTFAYLGLLCVLKVTTSFMTFVEDHSITSHEATHDLA